MRTFWALIALFAAIGLWFILDSTPNQRQGSLESRLARTPTDASARFDAPANNLQAERGTPTAHSPETSHPDRDSPRTSNSRTSNSRTSNSGASIPETSVAAANATDTNPTDANAPSTTLLQSLLAPAAPIGAKSSVAIDTRSPSEITRRIDARTLELDGRFRLVGTGSADDPYRISWELLTSAASVIDPVHGLLTPPPWVRAVDGSYVEISAYYSTAVRVSTTQNVLLTLNRWDGCCIGLPPTPFDAIDVTLAASLDMRGLHLFRFGTFRGRLVVEPFVAGTYLLGLYRLEDASFVAQ
jgi:hypothetical protein